ncbi:ankyrin repeat and KH domain-containing protein 1-like X4, partial [Biomphalaria pfeifferi]
DLTGELKLEVRTETTEAIDSTEVKVITAVSAKFISIIQVKTDVSGTKVLRHNYFTEGLGASYLCHCDLEIALVLEYFMIGAHLMCRIVAF